MRFLFLSCLCFLFLQADAQQQYTNTLKGLVRDAEMKESLPGATILVYADTLRVAATKTDDKGVFRIEQLPLQRYR
ncbi:MAG TPA: carboxypeptidase-like regulatory domain-containing protein, partial [Chitinophagaceae bacterium]|nr:carboxypeptidase-like regulatory domain-containing protein [Chitinophagaceae bacterium]